ncbi:MAG: hypothetical protein AAF587_35000 [Bacteroidota bacterium]
MKTLSCICQLFIPILLVFGSLSCTPPLTLKELGVDSYTYSRTNKLPPLTLEFDKESFRYAFNSISRRSSSSELESLNPDPRRPTGYEYDLFSSDTRTLMSRMLLDDITSVAQPSYGFVICRIQSINNYRRKKSLFPLALISCLIVPRAQITTEVIIEMEFQDIQKKSLAIYQAHGESSNWLRIKDNKHAQRKRYYFAIKKATNFIEIDILYSNHNYKIIRKDLLKKGPSTAP